MEEASSLFENLNLSGDQNAPSGVIIPDTATTTRLALSPDDEAFDKTVLEEFEFYRRHARDPPMESLLSSITQQDAMLTGLKLGQAAELLDREPAVLRVLSEAWEKSTFRTVRQLKILLPDQAELPFVPTEQDLSVRLQSYATQFSWGCQYVGEASEALWSHIRHHSLKTPRVYANFLAIVQSSGMGKSRAVDEMSKRHFVIPMNLREAENEGYPPADHAVREFLCAKRDQSTVYLRACAFLTALFDEVALLLQGAGAIGRPGELEPIDLNGDMASLSMQFREYMTAGTTMSAHGEFRRNFYATVVDRAEKVTYPICKEAMRRDSPSKVGSSVASVSPTTAKVHEYPPVTAFVTLESVIHNSETAVRRKGKRRAASQTENDPLIILEFDEAHTMAGRNPESPSAWSNLTELRRALRTMNNCSLFSLFLSTTGKIDQFVPQKHRDFSARIVRGEFSLIQPYTDLGFDQLAKKITSKTTLEDVTGDSFIAHLGRPMFGARYDYDSHQIKEEIVKFAAMKLLGGQPYPRLEPLSDHQKLACLAQRLPIEFNSTTSIAQCQEMEQVEGHLRVYLKADTAFMSMQTVSSSEPLLSEAAYWIMKDPKFDPADALKMILGGFAINKGDRGELLIMLLFIQARDVAVGSPSQYGIPECRWTSVTAFVQSLFLGQARSRVLKAKGLLIGKGDPTIQNLTFENAFSDSKVYFNHWIKVHQFDVLKAKYLLSLFCRGAAVLCANSQRAIDGVLPFLWKGRDITRDNLTVCIWQSKNDPAYTRTPKLELFDSMDPFSLQIFDPASKLLKPIIRIVFALAASEPSLQVVQVKTQKNGGGSFIAYDLWCSGLSPDILFPVKDKLEIWKSLLQRSFQWEEVYTGDNVPQKLRRSMNPGVAVDNHHWYQWNDAEMLM